MWHAQGGCWKRVQVVAEVPEERHGPFLSPEVGQPEFHVELPGAIRSVESRHAWICLAVEATLPRAGPQANHLQKPRDPVWFPILSVAGVGLGRLGAFAGLFERPIQTPFARLYICNAEMPNGTDVHVCVLNVSIRLFLAESGCPSMVIS